MVDYTPEQTSYKVYRSTRVLAEWEEIEFLI